MQKIKREVYDRLIIETLSRLELKFLLYMFSRCDEKGNVPGVYYAEISNEINCSEAKFYHLRDSLTNKNFISWKKNNSADIDITLIGNDFTMVTDGKEEIVFKSYIDINIEVFNNPQFYKTKAKAIQLALYIIKCVAAKGAITYANMKSAVNTYKAQATRTIWYNNNNEYKSLAKLLSVKVRALKEYFTELSQWIEINKVNDAVKDPKLKSKRIVTVLKNALLKPTYRANKNGKKNIQNNYPERFRYIHFVKTVCRRNNILAEENHISDVANLIFQYIKIFKDNNKNIYKSIETFICNSKTVSLNCFYIHSCLKNAI